MYVYNIEYFWYLVIRTVYTFPHRCHPDSWLFMITVDTAKLAVAKLLCARSLGLEIISTRSEAGAY